MIGDVIAGVVVWLLIGLVVFLRGLIARGSTPDSWAEAALMIVFWPLRLLGVFR